MIKKAIRKSYPILFIALLFAIAGSAFAIRSSYFIKTITDNILSTERSMVFLKENSIDMIKFGLLSVIFALIANFFKFSYSKKAMLNAKNLYIKKLFEKGINEFHSENTAKYFSNMTNDMSKIEAKYVMPIYNIIFNVCTALMSIGVLLYVNYILLLSAIGVGIFLAVMIAILGIPIQKHEKELSTIKGQYTIYVKEIISSFQIIKTNNLEDKAKHDFNKQSENVENKEYKLNKLIAYLVLGLGIMLGVLILVTIMGGIFLVYKKLITIGTFIFGFKMFIQIINPFGQIGSEIQAIVSIKEIFNKMNENLKKTEPDNANMELASFDKSIILKDTSFNYENKPILKNINFEFEKGKKYLITGPSGGGKTTILRLLRKYFNPTEGDVFIDEKNLKDIKTISYFKRIANIEQQVFLFEDSLRNNITLYKDYSDEEINNAIEKSGLSLFVKNLNEGLNYKIEDNGKNISGGEKARIAIARGLITKSNVILLDEAFASLDKDTAIQVEKTLLSLKDVTVVNVSHVIFDENKNKYDKTLFVKNTKIEVA